MQNTSSPSPDTNKDWLKAPIKSYNPSAFSLSRYLSPPSGVKEKLSDRFIPLRSIVSSTQEFFEGEEKKQEESPKCSAYSFLLSTQMLKKEPSPNPKIEEFQPENNVCNTHLNVSRSKNVLSFREVQKPLSTDCRAFDSPITSLSKVSNYPLFKPQRKIPSYPEKVLLIPGLKDDFYLNVLDWSSNDLVGLGVNNNLCILCENLTKMHNLYQFNTENKISCLAFNNEGTSLSAGFSNGHTYLLDNTTSKIIRSFEGHLSKVTCTSWCNSNVFSTGSRDRRVIQRDIRIKSEIVSIFEGHKQEVCGAKWCNNGEYLATGGNDSTVFIWQLQNRSHYKQLSGHKAAVKALAWNPKKRGILATGGGCIDKCIKIWDIELGICLDTADTGSQVCGLVYSKTLSELVSTQGYCQNSVDIWKYPSLSRIASLKWHSNRVLFLAMSPNGEKIITGASDETICLWKIFPAIESGKSACTQYKMFLSRMDLR